MSKLRMIVMILFVSIMAGGVVCASEVKVNALVESNEVGMSEEFVFQIQVESDSDDITLPDMTSVTGFTHKYLGGFPQSSTVFSNINGRKKLVTKKMYILSYKLSPKSKGMHVIPELTLTVDGKEYRTKPISINVSEGNMDDVQSILEYKLPRNKVYLGETVPVELVWSFRNSPQLNNIDVPAFTDDRFIVSKANVPTKVNRDERLVDIFFNGSKYWAIQSETIIDGVAYATITIKWYISAKETGRVNLLASSIIGSTVVGYKKSSRFGGMPRGLSSMFGDDPFFSGKEPIVKQFKTTTKPVSLDVLPLPSKGKPVNFSGVISPIKLGAEANTDSASVGEPIGVDLFVMGNDNIYNMELPDFNMQGSIKGRFKVSEDTTGQVIIGDMRRYKLTFRALTSSVSEIPPLEVSYFDPKINAYKTASTEAIPVKIQAAKIITASDIETTDTIKTKVKPLEENKNGIFENYVDEGVLVNLNIPVWKFLSERKFFLAIFPGCYFSLLLWHFLQRRRSSTASKRTSSRAIKDFESRMSKFAKTQASAEDLTEVITTYFKSKFLIDDREFTLSEMVEILEGLGSVEENLIENYKKIAEYSEACCYAGGVGQIVSKSFIDSVSKVMIGIDKEIG